MLFLDLMQPCNQLRPACADNSGRRLMARSIKPWYVGKPTLFRHYRFYCGHTGQQRCDTVHPPLAQLRKSPPGNTLSSSIAHEFFIHCITLDKCHAHHTAEWLPSRNNKSRCGTPILSTTLTVLRVVGKQNQVIG
jgi:hypothetical protein